MFTVRMVPSEPVLAEKCITSNKTKIIMIYIDMARLALPRDGSVGEGEADA